MMRYDLNNKVVIVTGASSGIGRSCVYQLAEKGAKLVLVSRNREKMGQIKKDLVNADTLIVSADLTKKEEVDSMVEKVIRHYQRIDILINNAGVGMRGSMITAPLDAFEKIIEINLLAVLYCTRAVYPYMKEKGGGIIVNVSSIAGLKAFYDSGLYSATKFAICGLTESLSAEAQPDNIRAILVCPGKTRTDFNKNLAHGSEQSSSKRSGVSPDVVAKAIVKGIMKNKKVIIVGKGCKTLYLLNRISPRFTNLLLKFVY